VMDLDKKGLLDTAHTLSGRHAVAVRTAVVDVTDEPAQRAAFAEHVATYGGLQGEPFDPAPSRLKPHPTAPNHPNRAQPFQAALTVPAAARRCKVVVLNAGIAERGSFFDPANTGWRATLDVDLTAVLYGASGLTASIALEEAGRVRAGETVLVTAAAGGTGQFAVQLAKAAGCRVVATCGGPDKAKLLKELGADRIIDHTAESIVIVELSSNFRTAARLVTAPLPYGPSAPPPPRGSLLVRRVYAGVNASDINYSSGRYHASKAEAQSKLPYDAGFESVNVVMAVGEGEAGAGGGYGTAWQHAPLFRPHLAHLVAMWEGGRLRVALDPRPFRGVGAVFDAVEHLQSGRSVGKVVVQVAAGELPPGAGLTASIALEEAGRVRAGETVLVTAAAGGTGQFAVQLAKAAGCRVVATCGGPDKARLLKELGADRVIDHTAESDVLKREYPGGVDVVYESVGGEMFGTAVDALAVGGRVIIIGMMSSYGSGWAPGSYLGLAEKLLWKSAAAVGFFLLRHAPLFRPHLARLVAMWEGGRLRVALDPRPFRGVGAVFDAVEHLQSGRSVGKVVVQVAAGELPLGASGEGGAEGGGRPAARL
ncbi:Zinc-binding alcohol dehydrogenase domain-containing protein 2, partial [Tetrabaena socialis]